MSHRRSSSLRSRVVLCSSSSPVQPEANQGKRKEKNKNEKRGIKRKEKEKGKRRKGEKTWIGLTEFGQIRSPGQDNMQAITHLNHINHLTACHCFLKCYSDLPLLTLSDSLSDFLESDADKHEACIRDWFVRTPFCTFLCLPVSITNDGSHTFDRVWRSSAHYGQPRQKRGGLIRLRLSAVSAAHPVLSHGQTTDSDNLS